MNLKTGSIKYTANSLSEANKLVSEYPEWTIMIKYKDRQYHYDGAEIGSTGVVVKWSLSDDCVIGQQFIIANDNYAPEMALAA